MNQGELSKSSVGKQRDTRFGWCTSIIADLGFGFESQVLCDCGSSNGALSRDCEHGAISAPMPLLLSSST